MPLQNRVTPFGEIVAVPARGLLMGNRGIIHDPSTRTLLKKRWSSKAWIVCSCVYKDHHREVMARRSWTELFFLDEATALAAGHRPCFFCRRAEAERFRATWALGNGGDRPAASEMDATLHRQRLSDRRPRRHGIPGAVSALPDGAMVAAAAEAYVIFRGAVWRWSFTGYTRIATPPAIDGVLTPPATVAALRAGYRPLLHPSLG